MIILVTFVTLTILTLVDVVLLIIALQVFVKVVQNSPIRQELNHRFVIVQLSCLILLGIVWLCEGAYVIYGADNKFDGYKATYVEVIIDMVGILASMSFFMIMSVIVYKSNRD